MSLAAITGGERRKETAGDGEKTRDGGERRAEVGARVNCSNGHCYERNEVRFQRFIAAVPMSEGKK